MVMLPRVCAIHLFLSLLLVTAPVDGQAANGGDTARTPPARAAGSLAGQKRLTSAVKGAWNAQVPAQAQAQAQGQSSQASRPARWPGTQQPVPAQAQAQGQSSQASRPARWPGTQQPVQAQAQGQISQASRPARWPGTQQPVPAQAQAQGQISQASRPARWPGTQQPVPAQAQAQGQSSQASQPSWWPATQQPPRRPQRRPGRQTPDFLQGISGNPTASYPKQTPQYLVCYLYPTAPPPPPPPPVYLGTRPSPPFVPISTGPTYPPYFTYRILLPANAQSRASVSEKKGSRESKGSSNKMFGPQPWYPSLPYPTRVVCQMNQHVVANNVDSQMGLWESSDYDSGYIPDNYYVDPSFDADPGIYDIPFDGEYLSPNNNFYRQYGPVPNW